MNLWLDLPKRPLILGSFKVIGKTRYVNDKQITDHYAIIPTGQGMSALSGLSWTSRAVYDVIVGRFLSIFYPAAVYQKVAITTKVKEESFFASFKVLAEPGYLKLWEFREKRRENLAALQEQKTEM